MADSRSIGKSSPIDLAKQDGAWAGSRPLTLKGRTIWIIDAHRGDGKSFVVRADEKLSAFVELERQALTVAFYLEAIHADPCVDQ